MPIAKSAGLFLALDRDQPRTRRLEALHQIDADAVLDRRVLAVQLRAEPLQHCVQLGVVLALVDQAAVRPKRPVASEKLLLTTMQ